MNVVKAFSLGRWSGLTVTVILFTNNYNVTIKTFEYTPTEIQENKNSLSKCPNVSVFIAPMMGGICLNLIFNT